MTDFAIRVRPTLLGRLVLLPLYVIPLMVAVCCTAVPVLMITAAVTSTPADQPLPAPLPLRIAEGVVMLLVATAGLVWTHRIYKFFVQRATMTLTPSFLHVGGERIELDDIVAAYFARRGGPDGFSHANRLAYNTLLLVHRDGSLIPLSPPPGSFTGSGTADTEIPISLLVSNVDLFLDKLVSLLGSRVPENAPLPVEALPFLHPIDANRRHRPEVVPRLTFGRRLARMTWR